MFRFSALFISLGLVAPGMAQDGPMLPPPQPTMPVLTVPATVSPPATLPLQVHALPVPQMALPNPIPVQQVGGLGSALIPVTATAVPAYSFNERNWSTPIKENVEVGVKSQIKIVAIADEQWKTMFQIFEVSEKNRFQQIKDEKLFLEMAQKHPYTTMLTSPTLLCEDGQFGQIECGQQRFFTTGVKLDIVKDQLVTIPQNECYNLATQLCLTPKLSPNKQLVKIHLKGTLSDVTTEPTLFPVTTFITPNNEDGFLGAPIPFTQFIEKPNISKITFDETFTQSNGSYGLVYLGKRNRSGKEYKKMPILSEIPYLDQLFTNISPIEWTEHVLALVQPSWDAPKQPERAVFHPVPTPPVQQASFAIPPSTTTASAADQYLKKLVQKYHTACAEGKTDEARKIAKKCIEIDPTCFGKY